MPHYKLTYFDSRGTGECIRLIFAAAKQEYEDHRMTREEWESIKDGTPFDQAPFLEVDGKKLAQSHAICRYLAKQFGLHGSTPFEEALIDSVADQAKDMQRDIIPYFMVLFKLEKGDAEKLKNEQFLPAIKKNYEILNKILKENGTGYLVGSKLTWVDLMVAENTWNMGEFTNNIENQYPEVRISVFLGCDPETFTPAMIFRRVKDEIVMGVNVFGSSPDEKLGNQKFLLPSP